MGAGMSCGGLYDFGLYDYFRRTTTSGGGRKWFRIDPVVLSKEEVTCILGRINQQPGAYLLYEDITREKICLAFKTADGGVAHYPIVKLNDLFYCNDFPFPYLESIVLYYQKYKFNDTRLTTQAILSPCLRTRRSTRISGYLKLRWSEEDDEEDWRQETDSHA